MNTVQSSTRVSGRYSGVKEVLFSVLESPVSWNERTSVKESEDGVRRDQCNQKKDKDLIRS